MKKWWRYTKKADFEEISRRYGIDKVTAQVIRNRDITGDEAINRYLNGDTDELYNPELMEDMDEAARLMWQAIDSGLKIRIIGDYDVDGVCSIYILFKGLKALGADADYDVPDRNTDGYGINDNLINKAYNDGIRVLITCDNGIAAISQVKYAKSLGMMVIITDHHDVQYDEADGIRVYRMPEADAVIDNKRQDCRYPFKLLCGAAVAYKFVKYMCSVRGREIYDDDDALVFAAMATICDVVDIVDENRIIAKAGLKRISYTSNKGLLALINAAGVNKYDISSYHIGFVIGPCLNASGRLESAVKAINMLLTDDENEASALAAELYELNRRRKELTLKAVDEAVEMVYNTDMGNDRVLVIHLPDCHGSSAGIVAGKVRERFYKPVIVLTGEGDVLKGSGRSIESYNMFEKLLECKDLFMAFGGHPMAAGMTLSADRLEEFRNRLNLNCNLSDDDLTEKIWIDVAMPIGYVSEELVNDLKKLEPFGKGNPKPVFAYKNLTICKISSFGRNSEYTKMVLSDEYGSCMEATGFFPYDELKKCYMDGRKISCLYYPEINEFREQKNLRIVITEYRIE